MKSVFVKFTMLGLSALIVVGGSLSVAAEPKVAKESSFGTIRAHGMETARGQAQDWLKSVGKTDDASQQQFKAIWADAERPLLDKVADTLCLGDPAAAKLMAEVRDSATAPKEVPAVIRNAKAGFFRANLALAYAKALCNRRIYEDASECLKPALVKASEVVDPAAYYFFTAVAEHGQQHKEEAVAAIAKLLDDVGDAPERYKMVSALMFFDMQSWQNKGLGKIGQLMGSVERRLEVARGGPKTQRIEKEIIRRLDEEIKTLEAKAKSGKPGDGKPGDKPGPGCPGDGSKPGDGNKPGDRRDAKKPAPDSQGPLANGKMGKSPRDFKDDSKEWGKLPERDRAKAMMDKVRDLPASSARRVIEDFYKKVASESSK
jgi:tetratricopeptide (TPR) repeat protein